MIEKKSDKKEKTLKALFVGLFFILLFFVLQFKFVNAYNYDGDNCTVGQLGFRECNDYGYGVECTDMGSEVFKWQGVPCDFCTTCNSTYAAFQFDLDSDGYRSEVCTGSPDCDESNPDLWQNVQAYVDSDLDSFGVGAAQTVCAGLVLPTGYAYVNGDCDDTNASKWRNVVGYYDSDRDNYGAAEGTTFCIGSNLPANYVQTNYDCNDADGSVWKYIRGCVDGDGDGYGAGSQPYFCALSLPNGYVANCGDCDDTDVSKYQWKNIGLDGDGDGTGAEGACSNTCIGGTIPPGYVIGCQDCDDANANKTYWTYKITGYKTITYPSRGGSGGGGGGGGRGGGYSRAAYSGYYDPVTDSYVVTHGTSYPRSNTRGTSSLIPIYSKVCEAKITEQPKEETPTPQPDDPAYTPVYPPTDPYNPNPGPAPPLKEIFSGGYGLACIQYSQNCYNMTIPGVYRTSTMHTYGDQFNLTLKLNIEYYNASNSSWQLVRTVYNVSGIDITLFTTTPSDRYLLLGNLWNGAGGWNSTNNSGNGTYRATTGIYDLDGNAVPLTDGGLAKWDYNFTLGTSGGESDNSPVSNLSYPEDNNVSNQGIVTFECNATDDSNLANVSLYIWNSTYSEINTNNTNWTGTTNSTTFTYNFTINDSYKWNCLVYDNASQGDWAVNRTINISSSGASGGDTTYPVFSNYWDNNGTLVDSGTGLFNVTVLNTNGTVWLEINGTNTTATNLSNVYNVSYYLLNGTYDYQWWAYGNGTSNLINNSGLRSYSVNESILSDNSPVSILSYPADQNVSEQGVVTFECNATDDYNLANVTLYIWNATAEISTNFTSWTGISNSTTFTYNFTINDSYQWNCLVYDNASQSDWDTNRTINITSPSVPDTTPPYFISIPENVSLSYLESLGVDFNAEDETQFDSYSVNDTRFTINSSGWLKNSTTLGVDLYLLNITINDSSNNLNSTIYSVNISQIAPTLTSLLNGINNNLTVTYPQQVNASGSTSGGTLAIYKDGTAVTNGANYTFGGGYYQFDFNVTGNQNYTNSSERLFVNITRAINELTLTINGIEDNKTIQNGSLSNVTCISNTSQGNLNLTRNGTQVDYASLIVNETQVLEEGYYNYTCIYEETQNYSANFKSLFLNVTSVDITGPLVTLLTPVNSYSTTDTSILFVFNISDEIEIRNCTLFVGSNSYENQSYVNKSTTNTITATLSVGSYLWSINCTDINNNQGNSSSRLITISSSDTPGGGGGGGGGGGSSITPSNGGTSAKKYLVTYEEYVRGATVSSITSDETVLVDTKNVGDLYSFDIQSILWGVVTVRLSNGELILLSAGQAKYIDTDGDGVEDTTFKVEDFIFGNANVFIQKITQQSIINRGMEKPSKFSLGDYFRALMFALIGLIVLVGILIGIFIFVRFLRDRKEEREASYVYKEILRLLKQGRYYIRERQKRAANNVYEEIRVFFQKLDEKEAEKIRPRVMAFYDLFEDYSSK